MSCEWTSAVGPTFVHITLGFRFAIGDSGIALHLGLIVGELSFYWQKREASRG